jgi:hypothetical protein
LASDPTEQAVAQLERDHPDWHVWVVRRVYGGPVWCARRRDETGRVLNEDSAGHLGGAIARAEAEPPGWPRC